MRAWRKYKKWKGQKDSVAVAQLFDYWDATYNFHFGRLGALLRAYRQSRPEGVDGYRQVRRY